MLADSHCHLNYKGLVEEQQAVLERARARGVTAMLNIATRESEWDAVLATAECEADVWATGAHRRGTRTAGANRRPHPRCRR
jgi:TatD DNase family protein